MDLQFRPDLLARGWTDADLRRMRRSGELDVVRRGSYRAGPVDGPDTPEARHALLVRATLPHLAPGWVVSHQSAAVLWGLPVWDVPLDRVHVSRDGTGGGRVTRGVHRHVGRLDAAEIVRLGGVRLTCPGRTVVDVAGSVPFDRAVVVTDAALAPRPGDRPPLLDRPGMLLALAGSGRVGRSAARRVVSFADGGARSPGESRSRVAMWRAGLPAPVLQYEVRGPDGRLLGFVDFGWPELRTVGEFDGRVKYGRLGRAGEDVLWEEKRREDALRATGLWVARWIWADLTDFAPTAARLAAALSSHR